MNRIFLSFVCLVFCFTASSQKVYFIYLQSEADQPFYVKMNNRVHSSTSSGYLILSRLHDSTYNFSVGFPGNKWPEQNFTLSVNKKDHGFLLKNFNEKGWGLFDLQTLTVQMPVAGLAKTGNTVNTENQDVSLFTDILSKAADDPSLKEKPVIAIAEKKVVTPVVEVAKKEERKVEKKEPVIAAVVKETETVQANSSTALTTKEEVKEPVKEKPAVVIEEKKAIVSSPEIAKKEEPKTDGSAPLTIKEDVKEPVKEIVITVKNPEPFKTIPREALKEPAKEAVVEIKAVDAPATVTAKEETENYQRSVVRKRSESSTTEGFGLVFIDETGAGSPDTIRLMIPNPKLIVAPQKSEPKEEKKFLDMPATGNAPVAVAEVKDNKITCQVFAVEADFFQVRKLMAAEEKDDDMIAAAQKYFKTKCFTTQQVKNLGALFLNDAARYKFFDMSYPYISDTANFTSLESELKDSYYLSQFKAIVKQ
ncbi:MAG TPA: DUF4476 domain-containing protein [Chitinophagaceae bacterium]|nr:DUF4476 domain-containing protein [Chitinophagaceae bacterium]